MKSKDLGNIVVDQPESLPVGPTNARYLPQIAQTCARLAAMVEQAAEDGHVPLVLGGDHSVAIGTVAGMSRSLPQDRARKSGLIWMDAHADMNTPQSSPSGNVHGMPLACIVGLGPRELTQHRRLSRPRSSRGMSPSSACAAWTKSSGCNVRDAGVHPFTMRDIDERGMRSVMRGSDRASPRAGTAGFHLSFDMDAVDPAEAPGVGTPVRGGITYREAHLAMEMVCDSRPHDVD